MSKYIDTENLHKVVLKRKTEYGSLADLIDNIVEEMVKETPYADVVEKDMYDVLQSESEMLRRQLHQSWNRIYELDKLHNLIIAIIPHVIAFLSRIPLGDFLQNMLCFPGHLHL